MQKLSLRTLLLLVLLGHAFTNTAAELDVGIYELNRGNFDKALAQFQPLVNEGYAPAQLELALMYQKGYGVKKDINKAIELLTFAANQNNLEALFNLSLLYADGDGVKQDLEKAFTLTEKAAKKNLPRAQFNLGVMYYNGEGVRSNYKLAARWYEKAAKQNYSLAQFNLALMYFEGKGLPKSTENSYLWNLMAAKNGYKPAFKSSQMDERNLSKKQIVSIKIQADTKRSQIQKQIDRRNRIAEQEYKNRQFSY